jgi:hypothetical protein
MSHPFLEWLSQRKKKLESHTNILQAAMKTIVSRDLPLFFEAETSDRPDRDLLLKLLGPSSKGTMSDKLRLLALLTLRAADASSIKLVSELEEVLRAGCGPQAEAELAAGIDAIKHMRMVLSFQQQTPAQVCPRLLSPRPRRR